METFVWTGSITESTCGIWQNLKFPRGHHCAFKPHLRSLKATSHWVEWFHLVGPTWPHPNPVTTTQAQTKPPIFKNIIWSLGSVTRFLLQEERHVPYAPPDGKLCPGPLSKSKYNFPHWQLGILLLLLSFLQLQCESFKVSSPRCWSLCLLNFEKTWNGAGWHESRMSQLSELRVVHPHPLIPNILHLNTPTFHFQSQLAWLCLACASWAPHSCCFWRCLSLWVIAGQSCVSTCCGLSLSCWSQLPRRKEMERFGAPSFSLARLGHSEHWGSETAYRSSLSFPVSQTGCLKGTMSLFWDFSPIYLPLEVLGKSIYSTVSP